MTEPQDSHSSTRPISVAELLARNGTIGAPPVGGRRRRRRGNSDSVTVAELTGEIPIVTEDSDVEESVEPEHFEPEHFESEHVEDVETDVDEASFDEPDQTAAAQPTNGVSARATRPAPDTTDAEADYAAHVEQRDAEPELFDFTAPPRRPVTAPRTGGFVSTGGAEQMSPDPLIDDEEPDDHLALLDIDHDDDDHAEAVDFDAGSEAPPSVSPTYRRSGTDTLFGGQSVADEQARRGRQPGPEDIDLGEEHDALDDVAEEAPEKPGSSFVRGVWVVAQCMLAVAFGAGLFIAFDQLWKWNSIVALVLGVLVILGLVVGVRVVRKTEDIGSTLIAVVVGAMVTIGPLALLQAH
ncbi:hypothetical protein [Mycobacterium sp. URHB0044]|uniref:hypothetical protein n=1 Tax=Mycobacterium sp. URHB0044 TaxID=1380386 RepID=UPI00048AF543|nr:hypothetical protein [Mycobacterium sp. URHB0044]